MAVPHGPQRESGLWKVFRQKGRLHLQSLVPPLRQLAAGWIRLRQPLGRRAGPHAPDCFSIREEWFSFALKQRAGFGKGGEKNFEGTVTDLQMGGYLLIRDFRQRINKRGAPYGWPLSIYTTPEALWGYDHISSAYSVDPAESKTMIYEQVGKNFPDAAPGELDAVLGWTR